MIVSTGYSLVFAAFWYLLLYIAMHHPDIQGLHQKRLWIITKTTFWKGLIIIVLFLNITVFLFFGFQPFQPSFTLYLVQVRTDWNVFLADIKVLAIHKLTSWHAGNQRQTKSVDHHRQHTFYINYSTFSNIQGLFTHFLLIQFTIFWWVVKYLWYGNLRKSQLNKKAQGGNLKLLS